MVYSQDWAFNATFGALSDPTRRAILVQLAQRERSIGELASSFDMTLPAVSKHVRVLASAGLADVRKEGRVRRCRIVAAPLRDAAEWIDRYRKFWEARFERLAAYLAAAPGSHEELPTWPNTSNLPQSPAPGPAPRSASPSRGRSKRLGRKSSPRGRRPKR